MFTSLKRIIKYGWNDFRRQKSIAFSTVFVMVMMLCLLSSLLLLDHSFKFLVARLEEKVDISVYFKEDVPEIDILKVQEEFEKIPEVKDIEYVSRESALEKFITFHRNNSRIMESLAEVGGNPLPASLNIRAQGAAQYAQVSAFLEKSPFGNLIDRVDYFERKPVIDRVFSIGEEINFIGFLLSLVLGAIAILLIFNQVRLSIYNTKKEIEIMRLVGASNWFVRGPFLIQGALVGFFAALITLLILLPLCALVSTKLNLFLPGLDIFGYLINNLFGILLIQLAVGVGLGIISSIIATRKYLEV